ncbi:hypothetical protein C8R48DRAFT_775325 [Suillus tomentosus]|nr:hypothetical protein C8R48DRAFT_775325 [Suillus tomentosus]
MNIINEAFVENANATAVDTPPEFDEWALSGLTKEKCVQNKSLARQGKREISRTESQASTTARSSSCTSSTSMYLPWPWFGLFDMFSFLTTSGLLPATVNMKTTHIRFFKFWCIRISVTTIPVLWETFIWVPSVLTSKKTTGGPAKRRDLQKLKVPGRFSAEVSRPVFPPSPAETNLKAMFTPDSQCKAENSTFLKPSTHNIFCCFCRDGGTLYDCYRCPRAVCETCVITPQQSRQRIQEPDVLFICPGCHEKRGNYRSESDSIMPYFGFEDTKGTPILTVPATINGHVEMSSRSQVCSDSVLILHFVLKGLQPSGSPAPIMREALEPYGPNGTIQYHEIIFDFGTDEKLDTHVKSMTKLVDEVRRCQYERVEVFIYTHSETVRGDIWGGFENDTSIGKGRNKVITPGEPVAYSVDDFFAGLFVGGIEDHIQGATLWMLVCGHIIREPLAFKSFKGCVKRFKLEHTFAFGAELFHASLTTPLITTYVDRVLIEGFDVQEVMQDLLLSCPRLAMHARIVHLHITNGTFPRRQPTIVEYNQGFMRVPKGPVSLTTTAYTYFHENNRPFGNALPCQCSKCMCVRTWKRVTSNISTSDESKFVCRKCKNTITYTRPAQSSIILFSQGYRRTSSVSGKLVTKGHRAAGSGWLVSATVESGAVADEVCDDVC